MATIKRNKIIAVPVTDDEKRAIELLADRKHLTTAAYIRLTLLGGFGSRKGASAND